MYKNQREPGKGESPVLIYIAKITLTVAYRKEQIPSRL